MMKRCNSPGDSIFAPLSKTCSRIQNRNYFPSDVLKFMKLNAKPRMSLKLMQVCKYFQHQKFPFNVISNLRDTWGIWIYTTFESKRYIQKKIEEIPDNLWIIGFLSLTVSQDKCAPIIKKILVGDVESLLLQSTSISINNLKFLCSNVRDFDSDNSIFYDENNKNVTAIENLLECLPKLESLTLDFSTINSLEHLNRVLPSKLIKIKLREFDKTGDFSNFASFMIQNQHIKYEIVTYLRTLSPPKYYPQLQSCIDRVIEEWECQNVPPIIDFVGQSVESKKSLKLLQERHHQCCD